MLKRVFCVLVTALVVVGVPVAGAATKHKAKNHSVTATVQSAEISSQGNPPVSGSAVDAGIVQSPLGNGAIAGTTTFAAPNFTSTFTVFLPHGSLKATQQGTGTLNPDGSISFSGTGKINGGTDTYKGAKGTFTFTGSQPRSGAVATFQVTGKVKY